MASSKDGGIRITAHGELRLRERLGLPDRAMERTARNALARGKRRSDFKGPFRKYLDYLHRKGESQQAGSEVVVYGENIFLFAGNVLITAWPRKWANG